MNSKNKGSSFERKVAKDLSKWWTNDKNNDDVFYKSQSSGARFTTRKKMNLDTENQHGDICASNDIGIPFTKHFFVECKHYTDINLWSIITKNKSGKLITWWNKIHEEIKDIVKIPILIAKQNNKPTLLVTTEPLFKLLSIHYDIRYQLFIQFEDMPNAFVYLFKDFLKMKPEDLISLVENR